MKPFFISAPIQSLALPWISMRPPFMWAPRCMPTEPWTVMLPWDMARPIHRTFSSAPCSTRSGLGSAFDVEKLAQRQLPLAVKDDQRPNLVEGKFGHHIRRKHFGFQRNGGWSFEMKGQGHGTRRHTQI